MSKRNEQLHKEYVQRLTREKRYVRMTQLSIFIFFFAFWEIGTRLGWIDPLLFSSPTRVWELFVSRVQDGSLFMHTSVTLFETIAGFLLGTVLGTMMAAILWWSPFLSRVLDPYLVILNSMPKVALGPILIVAFGTGFTSIIAMGALISVVITTLVVYNAFKGVDENYLKVIQSFGATKKQSFFSVIFPASYPTIISTLKVNVGLAWVGVIVGEFLVSKQGLGYMIVYGFQVFNFTLVMLSLIIIAILATIMYQLVELLEKKLIKRHNT
ncbi:ABC transporter permease [Evansella cellulosilytica]|uniref:Binding-protein-dependent transport systems inner membrane component n=1 Tax=Evansella cellulosilytica (strain ATCC 21833 / DSM 2522 / FERM P-1141 / JCM 9156 / N-4) TaxID=649639 RepID=E6U1S3_EVAC2|nr:ABC transporter permease [Evansella cellulosilytica]ADU31570.1 binding-protein-dependent transport systems inner membrane component [Evansella cellulosilytica DSM 2522]